jgi:hypothetical protein
MRRTGPTSQTASLNAPNRREMETYGRAAPIEEGSSVAFTFTFSMTLALAVPGDQTTIPADGGFQPPHVDVVTSETATTTTWS